MLTFVTIIIMGIVGYAYFVEGVFTAFLMFCNVLGAGIVTCSFWEPLAGQLGSAFEETFLAGYEDAFCLILLFCASLILLRTLTNTVVKNFVEFPEVLQRGGGVILGLLTGYMAAGFLLMLMQTLPMHEHAMSFDYHSDPGQAGIRAFLPPDRAWLAAMNWASASGLGAGDEPFDKGGSFELRYARYRRYNDDNPKQKRPVPYYGEFDEELGRR